MQIKPTLAQQVAYSDIVKSGLVFGDATFLTIEGVLNFRVTQFVNQIRFEHDIGNGEWIPICRIWFNKTNQQIKRIFTPFTNSSSIDQVRKLIDVYANRKLMDLNL